MGRVSRRVPEELLNKTWWFTTSSTVISTKFIDQVVQETATPVCVVTGLVSEAEVGALQEERIIFTRTGPQLTKCRLSKTLTL